MSDPNANGFDFAQRAVHGDSDRDNEVSSFDICVLSFVPPSLSISAPRAWAWVNSMDALHAHTVVACA